MAAPPQLVFPSAVDNLQADRGQIRAQLRDTYNRLHSIADDADFVRNEVGAAYADFPLVANQRAGAWYVKPTREHIHAYFKSTDGHAGQHDFNLRRANLILLPIIKNRGGIIIVDSTRRGKRFPDALSKTVPIWCAVLTRARMLLLPPSEDNSSVPADVWERQASLCTSPQAVGRSEHAQIQERIEEWAKQLASSAYDLSALRALDRPLRPFFVSPASTLSQNGASDFTESCYPVICASASKLAAEADGLERAQGFTYVQGSGDDHEAWSKGLTPPIFWAHADEILAASREEVDGVISRILSTSSSSSDQSQPSTSAGATKATSPIRRIRRTGLQISIRTASTNPTPSDLDSGDGETTEEGPLALAARPGKAGYNAFFSPAYLEPPLERAQTVLARGGDVLVQVAEEGEKQSEANDLGVAVALVLLTRMYSDSAELLTPNDPTPTASKDRIRTRLQWILEEFPTVNPSRSVLNRVNEFLISKRR
ncbi:initiator tRNA phosphoribosyl transferase [Rhodotorula sp. JG-1b]|nr:initiator tRNA phosphoribosyl transferase [Rhodotorula sp. JG-1b]